MRIPWYASWIVIVLCYALSFNAPVFAFVGLTLLGIRMAKDRQINYTAGRTIRGLGWLLVIGSIGITIYAFNEEIEEAIYVAGAIFIVGLLIIQVGNSSIKKGNGFFLYVDAVYNHGVRSIHQLAAMLNKTPAVAQEDVQSLINKGHIKDGIITNSMIILPVSSQNMANNIPAGVPLNSQPPQVTTQNGSQNQQAQTGAHINSAPPIVKQPRTVVCKGCGNSMVIRSGEEKECEFCGNINTYGA